MDEKNGEKCHLYVVHDLIQFTYLSSLGHRQYENYCTSNIFTLCYYSLLSCDSHVSYFCQIHNNTYIVGYAIIIVVGGSYVFLKPSLSKFGSDYSR